ncbi:hypothetical protein F5Y07DRAFT_347327 [Xylaria sp. FL0933]|nr:hypothetical protein F5Y07DRAFT_347327 [Xylaria sp. FL0933]
MNFHVLKCNGPIPAWPICVYGLCSLLFFSAVLFFSLHPLTSLLLLLLLCLFSSLLLRYLAGLEYTPYWLMRPSDEIDLYSPDKPNCTATLSPT